MLVETSRFGAVAVQENDILRFPEGILGFSKLKEYVMIERQDDSLFVWLQAMKKATVAFPLLEPQLFEPNYRVEIEEEDRKLLKLTDLKWAKVFAIVTIPSDPSKMTANLKAPVLINVKTRLAKQIILQDIDYPIRKAIFTDLQRFCETTQRTIFPTSEAASYQTIHLSEELVAARS